MIKWFTKLQCLNFFQANTSILTWHHYNSPSFYPFRSLNHHQQLGLFVECHTFQQHKTRAHLHQPASPVVFGNNPSDSFGQNRLTKAATQKKNPFGLWDIMKVIAPSSIWLPHCTLDSSPGPNHHFMGAHLLFGKSWHPTIGIRGFWTLPICLNWYDISSKSAVSSSLISSFILKMRSPDLVQTDPAAHLYHFEIKPLKSRSFFWFPTLLPFVPNIPLFSFRSPVRWKIMTHSGLPMELDLVAIKPQTWRKKPICLANETKILV